MLRRWIVLLLLLAGAVSAQTPTPTATPTTSPAPTAPPTGPAPAFPHPDGTNCGGAKYPLGMDQEGNAQDCTAVGALGSPSTFGAGDTTPDVSGSNYWASYDTTGMVITDFDFGSGVPVPDGYTFWVKTVPNKLTFNCETGNLQCGSNNITTNTDERTEWMGTGARPWLVSFQNQIQDHNQLNASQDFARFYNTTFARNLQVDGFMDLGFVRYFPTDRCEGGCACIDVYDTGGPPQDDCLVGGLPCPDGLCDSNASLPEPDPTPDVSQGTFFYTWGCEDDYDAHCVDVYNSSIGRGCGDNEAQCSCAGFSPPCADDLCDFDGISVPSQAPQREGSSDNLCDADAITAAPSDDQAVIITDFTGGIDGQYIKIVTKSGLQAVTYDCNASGPLVCGTEDWITNENDVTSWVYNGIGDDWHLNGFEDNSSGPDKAAIASANVFTATNSFEDATSFVGTATFFGTALGDNSGTTWSLTPLGRAEFLDYVRADQFATCNYDGCNDYMVFGDGAEEYLSFFTDAGTSFFDNSLQMAEMASVTPIIGAGWGTFWVKSDTPNTPWFQDDTGADHELAVLTGGIYTGNSIFNDDVKALFGTDSDAGIFHDNTNFNIDNTTGYTDITGAIFVSEDEDVYSQIGGRPNSANVMDAIDMLVVRKQRLITDSRPRRAIMAVLDLDSNGSHGSTNFVLNAGAYTLESGTYGNTKDTAAGSPVGGRYFIRHQGEGLIARAGGISAQTAIWGGTEDGTITNGYGFMDEGGDGGAGDGEITNYRGFWVLDSIGEVINKIGFHIESLTNASGDNVGIQLDGADTAALWFNNDSGTSNDGMFFGTGKDTDWFRSAAGVLKTTGAIIALGDGTGTFGTYDVQIGSADFGALRLGSSGIYSSDFSTGNIDLSKTLVFRNEATVSGILEFAFIESGNTLRAGIPESGAGNATNFFRSFMIAGPYLAATGDDHFVCDTHTAYDGNIDCDTSSTGADMFIQDDLEVEGTAYFHETINLEGSTADGNHVILAVEDPASDVTHTFPTATGKLLNSDRKCARIDNGLTTGLQLETIWAAHLASTITGIWCETDAGTAGVDLNIDDGSPAGVNGSDISCSTTPTWDQTLAGGVAMAQGDRLDIDVGTVATATRLTVCFDVAVD